MADSLNTVVKLTVGQLFFWDVEDKLQRCIFQFNPTEIERSRTIAFTRTPTGNTLEEPHFGVRNQPKRKFTRKPEPWQMTLALRFDAGYGLIAQAEPSPPPRFPEPVPPPPPPPPSPTTFKNEIERIAATIQFFEGLVEPSSIARENDKAGNAHEAPAPPFVYFAWGQRSWQCVVKTARIKEEDYTYDLYPRRVEVTLTLEVVETVQQIDQEKKGAVR